MWLCRGWPKTWRHRPAYLPGTRRPADWAPRGSGRTDGVRG